MVLSKLINTGWIESSGLTQFILFSQNLSAQMGQMIFMAIHGLMCIAAVLLNTSTQ